MMAGYGVGPSVDEVEVTIFGPGYGEALVIHLGGGVWVLIDSCIEPSSKIPAALFYLNDINISTDDVRIIIASHWHDDHVKGMAALVKACTNAELIISGVFNDKESFAFLCAYGDKSCASQSGGTRELFQAVNIQEAPVFAFQRSIILEENIQGRDMRVMAFSPTNGALVKSKLHLAKYLPKAKDEPINFAPDLKPNMEAIVVHIDLGDDAILLGSDLENLLDVGWGSVTTDRICSKMKNASVYKVAHHGSKTGDHPDIWNILLKPKPVAMLAPFLNGNVKLPTDSDTNRIKGKVSSAYISSGASKKPNLSNDVLRRLSDIGKNISQVNSGFGAVRFRKQLDSTDWKVELFGNAKAI